MKRLFCFALLAAAGHPAYPQSSPIRIAGVQEPPEFTGEPKQVSKPDELLKSLSDIVLNLDDEAKAKAALPKLDAFLLEHPGYSDGYFMRAMCSLRTLKSPDYASILKDVETAMSTHASSAPKSMYDNLVVDHYSLRGKLKLLLGRYGEAMDDLEAAMKVDLYGADSIFKTGAVEPEKTSTPCAWNLADLDTLVVKFPKDYRSALFRGLYYRFFTTFNEEYYPIAKQEFQKAALLNPKSALPHFYIGTLCTKASFWTKAAWASDEGRNERHSKAIPEYTKAIMLDPRLGQAYEERASSYLNLKQYTQAIRDYDKILELDPEKATAYADRGLAKMESGNYLGAIADLGAAIRRQKPNNSNLSNSYELRGDAYIKAGMYADAARDYSSAIERQISSASFLLNLKQIRALYPEYDNVSDEALCRKIHSLFWPEFDYDVIAKKLLEGEGEWAVSFLLTNVYEKRGDSYLKAGNFRRAALDFQRIFKGAPNLSNTVERWREWAFSSAGDQFLVDVKSMEFAGTGPPRLWLKMMSQKKATYTVQALEFDCRGRRLNVVSTVVYDSDGQVVNSSEVPGGWQRIVPDTMGERLYNGICSSGQ